MTTKLSTSIFVLALFLGTSSHAADVYHRDSIKDSPSAATEAPDQVNWNGLYVGIQGGWADSVIGDEDGSGGIASSGFIGGGQVGFDIQRGRWVFGPFAEYNFSNSSLEIGGYTLAEKQDEWSIGGRLGYLVGPRTLLYGALGYTQADFTFGNDDYTFDGVSPRVGLEHVLAANTTLALEGRYTHFIDDKLSDNNLSLDDKALMAVARIKLNGSLPYIGN